MTDNTKVHCLRSELFHFPECGSSHSTGTWLLRAPASRSPTGTWMKWRTWLSNCRTRLGSRCSGSPAISLPTKGHFFHDRTVYYQEIQRIITLNAIPSLELHMENTFVVLQNGKWKQSSGHVTGTWTAPPRTRIVTFWLMLVLKWRRDWISPRSWVQKILVRFQLLLILNPHLSGRCCSCVSDPAVVVLPSQCFGEAGKGSTPSWTPTLPPSWSTWPPSSEWLLVRVSFVREMSFASLWDPLCD